MEGHACPELREASSELELVTFKLELLNSASELVSSAAELADFALEQVASEREEACPGPGQGGPETAISLSRNRLAHTRSSLAFLTLETRDSR
jgi:hypothetical protein